MFEYKFKTLLPDYLVICALETDSYLFDNILIELLSVSLICCSVYSFPEYCFELPDKAHVTSLSLFSVTSFSSTSFIIGNSFFFRFLLDLITSELTSFLCCLID